MALALNFTFGSPCSGGNHVPVTASLTGYITRARTYTMERTEVLTAPTGEDVEAAMSVILKLLIVQLSNKSNANIKSVVEAKTINLTVTG